MRTSESPVAAKIGGLRRSLARPQVIACECWRSCGAAVEAELCIWQMLISRLYFDVLWELLLQLAASFTRQEIMLGQHVWAILHLLGLTNKRNWNFPPIQRTVQLCHCMLCASLLVLVAIFSCNLFALAFK